MNRLLKYYVSLILIGSFVCSYATESYKESMEQPSAPSSTEIPILIVKSKKKDGKFAPAKQICIVCHVEDDKISFESPFEYDTMNVELVRLGNSMEIWSTIFFDNSYIDMYFERESGDYKISLNYDGSEYIGYFSIN